jgi:hypothetical protein
MLFGYSKYKYGKFREEIKRMLSGDNLHPHELKLYLKKTSGIPSPEVNKFLN